METDITNEQQMNDTKQQHDIQAYMKICSNDEDRKLLNNKDYIKDPRKFVILPEPNNRTAKVKKVDL